MMRLLHLAEIDRLRQDGLLRPASAPPAARQLSLISLYLRLSTWRCHDLRDTPPAPLNHAARQALIAAIAGQRALGLRGADLFSRGYAETLRIEDLAAAEARAQEERRDALRRSLIYLGTDHIPQSYTTIGWRTSDGRRVALSRDGGQLILAAGNLGSGKSQTSTTIAEGVLSAIPGISSEEHRDTAVISLSYVPDGIRLPDVLEALRGNQHERDRVFLQEHFLAQARPLDKMRLVIPDWLRGQYEDALRPHLDLGLQLVPLRVRLPQLAISGIETLLGGDEQAAYIQAILAKAQQLGDDLNLHHWREAINADRHLTSRQKGLAHARLGLLGRIEGPEHDLWDLVEPGTYSVVVLGGRWIRDSEAFPLIMALMNALTQPSQRLGLFQRFFVVDEVNRYDRSRQVMEHLLTTARQIRHRGSMLMLCGQDFRACLDDLVALATVMMVFRLNSPEVLEDLRRRAGGFRGVRFGQIHGQVPGQATVAVSESTDAELVQRAQQIMLRPPLCQHGGYTKAVL